MKLSPTCLLYLSSSLLLPPCSPIESEPPYYGAKGLGRLWIWIHTCTLVGITDGTIVDPSKSSTIRPHPWNNNGPSSGQNLFDVLHRSVSLPHTPSATVGRPSNRSYAQFFLVVFLFCFLLCFPFIFSSFLCLFHVFFFLLFFSFLYLPSLFFSLFYFVFSKINVYVEDKKY